MSSVISISFILHSVVIQIHNFWELDHHVDTLLHFCSFHLVFCPSRSHFLLKDPKEQ